MKRLMNAIAFAVVWVCFLPSPANAEELLIPVGEIIGLELSDDTVTVASFDDALGSNCRDAGLRVGDEILSINGSIIDCAEDIRSALQVCDGQVDMTIRRGSKKQTLHLPPANTEDGPRLGVYLKQGIAGIGTITFYDPDSGLFGTLGHGVSDSGGHLAKMTSGKAFDAQILSVKKGKCGHPAQLRGSIDSPMTIGTLQKNTPQGVFGISKQGWHGEPLPVADYEDIKTGKATIRSTVCDGGVQEYSVEILKIYPEDRSDHRNFLIKVTDPKLLEATGGIVQGMSGSPIIQDSKLVGAVTHVLVNDPTMGYGIFIENMLKAAG